MENINMQLDLNDLINEVFERIRIQANEVARPFRVPSKIGLARKMMKPLVGLFNGADLSLDEQLVAINLYILLQSFNLTETVQLNVDNNQLLASAVINAIKERKLILWRYVCMPKTDLIMEGEGYGKKFLGWQAEYNSRYDTLSPALIRDSEVIEAVRNLGMNTELNLVLNDWEVPFYRSGIDIDQLRLEEFQKCMSSLQEVRDCTTSWISEVLARYGIRANVRFFSQSICPDYQEFLDLVRSTSFEREGLVDENLVQAEIKFVEKADQSISGRSAYLKALRRIYQYAVESVFIGESDLGRGIYLNAEYPTGTVWQKMRILQPLPTLFYVTDAEVKNI